MKPYTKEEIERMRNCECSIPCIVYCNVVIRQIMEEEK